MADVVDAYEHELKEYEERIKRQIQIIFSKLKNNS